MNNSPYLDKPLLPLAVALPRMLEKIETSSSEAREIYASLVGVRLLRSRKNFTLHTGTVEAGSSGIGTLLWVEPRSFSAGRQAGVRYRARAGGGGRGSRVGSGLILARIAFRVLMRSERK